MQSPGIIGIHFYFSGSLELWGVLSISSRNMFASFTSAVLLCGRAGFPRVSVLKLGRNSPRALSWGSDDSQRPAGDLPQGKRHFRTNFKSRTLFHYLQTHLSVPNKLLFFLRGPLHLRALIKTTVTDNSNPRVRIRH